MELNFGSWKDYEKSDNVIGQGKYSIGVFEGTRKKDGKDTDEKVAIKMLKRPPTTQFRLKREIMILQHLHDSPNIIKLVDYVGDATQPSLILEHINTQKREMVELQRDFSKEDVRYYMYAALKALDACHSARVIHCDMKPGNILIDTQKKELRLADFGSAIIYSVGWKYNEVGTRNFKAPELLVPEKQRFVCELFYSLDIWALGCIFAGWLFQRTALFQKKETDAE